MILPSIKRINTKDFPPENQALIEQLGATTNDNIQPVFDALNKKLTIDDNFLGSIRDVEVVVNAAGTPVSTTFLATNVPQPKGLIVIRVENLTNSTVYPTGAPFITYNIVNGGLQITNVTGLPINNRFVLRVLTLG